MNDARPTMRYRTYANDEETVVVAVNYQMSKYTTTYKVKWKSPQSTDDVGLPFWRALDAISFAKAKWKELTGKEWV